MNTQEIDYEKDLEFYASSAPRKLTYTVKEVSEILNISVSQAYKLANENKLPTLRLGRRVLFSIKKIENFINA